MQLFDPPQQPPIHFMSSDPPTTFHLLRSCPSRLLCVLTPSLFSLLLQKQGQALYHSLHLLRPKATELTK
ncbi:hypothetical protein E2C01_066724 [Portunus trituberculatus]|uniref:Uncharacterized protein n=1 Tax=Portunus trituberculatus TaxID=210409 RepID=A0A5B7HRN0_PORTR|nr:hypothetical protein [Portunus trituberculatus]